MRRLVFFFSLLLSFTSYAYDVEVNGIYFDVYPEYGEATVTVSGNVPYSGDICIPESVSYEGEVYPVTSIRRFAFSGCRGVTSVSIPSSVTSIGESAFTWTDIVTIEIPNSVTYIGKSAFSGCI